MSTIQYTPSVLTRAFRANFFLSSPTKRLQWEKMSVVPCLNVIMVAFFFREIYGEVLFLPDKRA